MSIKASDVKDLREKTGAGMMDCKRALVEAQGDFAKAERLLKEMGLAQADKRSGRSTNEGRVFARIDGNCGALLELSCETDFVARNEDFINLGESRTVTLKKMIGLIEENLGRKAKIARLPLQPGDMPITYADISKARQMLGYDPRTTIEDGIRSFVDWYREWKARRR